MLICPDCGSENIEGSDLCDACGQTLTELSVRVPQNSIEADLLRARVSEIPNHPPVMLSATATVGEVLKAMVDHRIGCVLLLNEAGTMAGIFTERDALMRLNVDAADRHELPIERFMTPNPATIPAGAKIAFGLQQMNMGGYRHLPVIDGDKPVSVISIRDMLRYLMEHTPKN